MDRGEPIHQRRKVGYRVIEGLRSIAKVVPYLCMIFVRCFGPLVNPKVGDWGVDGQHFCDYDTCHFVTISSSSKNARDEWIALFANRSKGQWNRENDRSNVSRVRVLNQKEGKDEIDRCKRVSFRRSREKRTAWTYLDPKQRNTI